MLVINNLTAGHHGQVIVSIPDLALQSGQTCLLYGQSGSGKTTLLHALAGFGMDMALNIKPGQCQAIKAVRVTFTDPVVTLTQPVSDAAKSCAAKN